MVCKHKLVFNLNEKLTAVAAAAATIFYHLNLLCKHLLSDAHVPIQSGENFNFNFKKSAEENWWLKCNYTARKHQIKMFAFRSKQPLEQDCFVYVGMSKLKIFKENSSKRFFSLEFSFHLSWFATWFFVYCFDSLHFFDISNWMWLFLCVCVFSTVHKLSNFTNK